MFKKNPGLEYVFSLLNNNSIHYGLYAGSHVSLLTSNRIPTDIDILVSNQDVTKIKKLFPHAKIEGEKKINEDIYVKGGAVILEKENVEFAHNLVIEVGDKEYQVYLSNLVWKNIRQIIGKRNMIYTVPVEDTIIIKAILQRGEELGKHDLSDIEELLKVEKLNKRYLDSRLNEVKANERVVKVLERFGI
ncbi:nucleotidyltransferase family protein [Patescibacteria group bacterium]